MCACIGGLRKILLANSGIGGGNLVADSTTTPSLGPKALRLSIPNPYPGPRPFEPDEFRKFAGRHDEISQLSSLISSHQAALLYPQPPPPTTPPFHLLLILALNH